MNLLCIHVKINITHTHTHTHTHKHMYRDELDKIYEDKRAQHFSIELETEYVVTEEEKREEELAKVSKIEVSDLSNEKVVVLTLVLQDNLVIRNRGWKGQIFKDCFTGADVCKWLIKEAGLGSIDSCREFGAILIENKVLFAVKREGEPLLKELKDGPFFYRFKSIDREDELTSELESEGEIMTLWKQAMLELSQGKQPRICRKNGARIMDVRQHVKKYQENMKQDPNQNENETKSVTNATEKNKDNDEKISPVEED